ncbi:MAG: glycosyltransferase [Acidobacteriota bacterium]|nr:glycosyltransferase [Acidobacteriota bacterium]
MPTVSVVVPTCGRPHDLAECLDAIERLDPRPLEVIVVDSAPRDTKTRELAAQRGVRYVSEVRAGAARARNRGAQAARGDIVAFTDDDAVPEPGWLAALLPEFDDPRVALVTGFVAPPRAEEDTKDAALAELYELSGFTGLGSERIVLDRDTPDWFPRANFRPFGIAPNLAIRRSALERWEGFDVRLGPGTPVPGHEEQRAFHELIELGYRIVYQPAARVVHPSSPRTPAALQRRALLRMQASSAYLMLLLCEEPRHRREVFAHMFGKLRPANGAEHNPVPLARWRRIAARLSGLLLYFRARAGSRSS